MSLDGQSGPMRVMLSSAIVGRLESFRTAWAMRALDWSRRAPYLPVPDFAYLKWRLFTAYGSYEQGPDRRDLRSFLRWRSELRRYIKAGR